MNRHSQSLSTLRPLAVLIAAAGGVALTTAAVAQDGSAAITELTRVDLEQTGSPPTGPYAVVVEHDPGLATHTIYRPAELSMDKHPVLVWGEGGCANNGLMFPEFLSEIASYGFVIVADGPPGARGAGEGGPNGAAARAGRPGAPGAAAGPGGAGPRPANAPAGGARPAGPPAGIRIAPDGTDLVAAMDWIEHESADRNSRFYDKVDVTHVAAMGMSCGGLMSYGASSDPRVATVGIWNSGLLEPDKAIYDGLHGSVIIVTGGESDIAYANGKRDFEQLPREVPVFYGVYPSVGHGGTYNQDNGGPFGLAAVAWLRWQLEGDTGASGRGYFVGNHCGLCADDNWIVTSRSLP